MSTTTDTDRLLALEKPTLTTPALTVPLNADGTIGTLPPRLQEFVDGLVKKATSRRSEPLPDPVEKERLRQLEEENQQFKVSEAERQKRYEEALGMREAKWKEEQQRLEAEIDKRTQRLADFLSAEIRAAALKFGARPESVADVALILSGRVAIGDDLSVVVLDEHGQPQKDGTIEALVKSTLEAKPYFVQAPPAGGGARGGASMTGAVVTGEFAALEKALADAQVRVQRGDLSAQAIDAVFQADKALKAAQRGKR